MPVPPVIQMYRYVMGSGGGLGNLLKASEEFQQTVDWVRYPTSSQTPTVNADSRPDPNGGTTADQVGFTANTGARLMQTVTLKASTQYTFSVHARAVSGSVDFRMRNITLKAAVQKTATTTGPLTNGFTRFTYTFTTGAAGSYELALQNASGTPTARDVIFWGAMLNQGGTALDYEYAAPTTGGSAPAPAYAGFGDAFGGVTAYYSLRQFTEAETLNAIRVRRSSDDTEQDIGFDANGDLDTTALLAFVGTGGTDNGFVTTFYDQSGNGNNATNATESEQPLVVSGGSVVTENGKAAIEFSGNPVYFDASSAIADAFTGNSVYYKFEVAQVTSTSKGGILCANTGYRSFFNPPSYDYANFHNPNGLEVISSLNVDRTNQFLFSESFDANTGGGTYELYGNGSLERSKGSEGTSTLDTPTSVYIGRDPSGGTSGYLVGKIQEIIFFDSDQSANLGTVTTGGGTLIQGNINTHFNMV